MRIRGVMALAATAAIVVGACSNSGSTTAPATAPASAGATAAASAQPSTAASAGPSVPTELGSTQGQTINVLAWPGYVENGSTDKAVDWVTDFQTESGCTVNAQIFGTSDEAYAVHDEPRAVRRGVGVG